MFAMFVGTQSASAKEDVTGTYLSNADLKSLDGWTLDKTDWTNGYNDYKTDGDVAVIEFYNQWTGDASKYGTSSSSKTFDMSQAITLPAGYYRLKVNAFYREGAGNGSNEKAFIYATTKTDGTYDYSKYVAGLPSTGVASYTGTNDLYKAANAFSLGDFANEFDFDVDEDNTSVTVGFHGVINTYISWCILGPVTLYKYEMSDFTEEFNTKVTTAKSLYDSPMNATVLATLKSCAEVDQTSWTKKSEITAAEAELDEAIAAANTSIAKYAAVAAALETLDAAGKAEFNATEVGEKYVAKTYTDEDCTEAFAAAAKKQTTAGADMTLAIVNPTIDGQSPWQSTKTISGNGPMHSSNAYFEYWSYTLGQGGFNYYQDIEGLPAGKYTVSAEMMNDQASSADAFSPAAGVYAKNGATTAWGLVTSYAGSLTRYTSDQITVTDGKLTIGVGSYNADNTMPARWFVADNFKLTFVEAIQLQDYYDQIAALITAANENASKPQTKTVADALTVAVDATSGYESETNTETLQGYIDNLNTAVSNSTASINAYASLKTALDNENWQDRSEAFTSATTTFTYRADAAEGYTNQTLSTEDATTNASSMMGEYRAYLRSLVTEYKNATAFVTNAHITTAVASSGTVEGWEYTTGAGNHGTLAGANNYDNNELLFENWKGGGLTAGDMKNTVKNLPNGKYFLKAIAFTRNAGADDYIYIKSGETTAKAPTLQAGSQFINITDPIEVTNGEVEIGLHVGSGADWAAIGNVELYAYSVDDYTRTTATGKYGTICLPYAFTATGATLYSAKLNETKDAVTLEVVETTPEAGKPYIYKATDGTQTFQYANADMVSEPVAADPLTGVFAETTVAEGKYVMQTQEGKGQQFYAVTSGDAITLDAYKAYLTVSSGAKAINICLDGDATAISAVNALIDGSAKIYDLNGRQLSNLKKGVNIVNGVKVIVK